MGTIFQWSRTHIFLNDWIYDSTVFGYAEHDGGIFSFHVALLRDLEHIENIALFGKSHFPFQISSRMFPHFYLLQILLSASKYRYAKIFIQFKWENKNFDLRGDRTLDVMRGKFFCSNFEKNYIFGIRTAYLYRK